MAAPVTFNLPTYGAAPNQYSTETALEQAVQVFGNAIFDLLAEELRSRRVVQIWSESFADASFPQGTAAVLQASGNKTSTWVKMSSAPNPITARDQQDKDGFWWRRLLDSADMVQTLRNAGMFSLTNIGGTENIITASFTQAAIDLGITVAEATVVEFTPVAANTGNVTLQVGTDQARSVRTESGSELSAGILRAGVSVSVKRRGNNWYLFTGGVIRADMVAERAATVANLGAAGLTRLINVAGTADAVTAEIPAGAADLGGVQNGSVYLLKPNATNTVAGPTLQIIGSAFVRTLQTEAGNSLPAGNLVVDAYHVIQITSNGTARVMGVFVKPSELPAIRSTLTTTSALASSLNNTVTTLVSKSTLEYALQTGASLPARPNAPVVHWMTWSDPTAFMGAADLWFRLPDPTVPDMPSDQSWRWSNARTGNSGVLQILSLPAASPPLTWIEYQIDGGAWVQLPAALGNTPINGLTNGQSYNLALRYRNFVGAGVPTLARPMTVAAGPFSDNFDRADQSLSNDPRWLDVVIGGSNRKLSINANGIRPAANNETYVTQVGEYFAADQYVEAQIVGAGTNTAAGRGSMIYLRMPDRVHSGYRLRLAANTWTLARVVNGVTTTLASGTHAGTYPVQARLVAIGRVITATIGGVIVATYTDNDPAAFLTGTAGLGANAAGSDSVNTVRVDNFVAGNA